MQIEDCQIIVFAEGEDKKTPIAAIVHELEGWYWEDLTYGVKSPGHFQSVEAAIHHFGHHLEHIVHMDTKVM